MCRKPTSTVNPTESSSNGSQATVQEYKKWSLDWTTRWESPFNSWTEEDWKTRKFPTRAELKALIPEHCFERSALKGFVYLARDFVLIFAVYSLFRACGLSAELPTSASGYVSFVSAWFLYALVMGGFLAGPWVIAHECGHHAFSPNHTLNDFVGWVIHSAMFVPYFSWQFTHGKHHRRTNDLVEGETHIADTLDDHLAQAHKAVYDVVGERIYIVLNLIVHFTLYFPIYFNGLAGGGKLAHDGTRIPDGTVADHFRPNSPMFPPKWRLKVLLSDIGILLAVACCYQVAQTYGYLSVFLWYALPIFTSSHLWVVLITWLHHTHPTIPHFGPSDWTWVKGTVVGTVDRPNPLIDFIGHYIGSTHVCHHLFHEIPFYHATEATEALRAYLGPRGMYNCDNTHFFKATYLAAKHCHFVEGEDGVQFYKSFKSLNKKESPNKKEQ